MTDLSFAPVTRLSEMIAAGEVSARQLVDHCIARIEAHNPDLNAVVAIDFDRARDKAAAADEAQARGELIGPLHGIPMTIKDAFECEGLVSTGGAEALKDHVPDADAAVVARLKAAGAIVLGKTNVPAYSGDWQSFNEIYGATSNPWARDRTPGGSSGGAAAAVAAGLVPIEIGSDIGGSIRLPAHFCGLFGLKTSYGAVPMRGHIPPAPRAISSADLAVAGPLARSSGDLGVMLSIMSGAADDEAFPHAPLSPSHAFDDAQMRIGVWREEPEASADADVRGAVETAAQLLEAAGAEVTRGVAPKIDFGETYLLYRLVLSAIVAADFPDRIRDRLIEKGRSVDADDRGYAAVQARGAALTYREMMSIEARRAVIKNAWAAFFEDYDAVLCPAAPVTAFAHDHDPAMMKRGLTVDGEDKPYFDLMHWAAPATFAHLPAAVAPVAKTEAGLPVGVQIIGPYLGDRTVIDVARAIERQHGGFTAPPAYA